MPDQPSSNPRQIIQGAPVLHVQDVTAAAAFYRDVLGFTWDFGDESYAVVWRDNEIVGRGAKLASKPVNQPYGIREFGLTDVNGVSVVFGQDSEVAG